MKHKKEIVISLTLAISLQAYSFITVVDTYSLIASFLSIFPFATFCIFASISKEDERIDAMKRDAGIYQLDRSHGTIRRLPVIKKDK